MVLEHNGPGPGPYVEAKIFQKRAPTDTWNQRTISDNVLAKQKVIG